MNFRFFWTLCKNRGNVVKTEDLFQEVWQEKYYEQDNKHSHGTHKTLKRKNYRIILENLNTSKPFGEWGIKLKNNKNKLLKQTFWGLCIENTFSLL